MDMPKMIKIGPHMYTVVRKTAPDELGHCECNILQIGVKPRLRKSKARETLVHEILHACTHPSFLGNDTMTDEDFVTAVAPVLLQVLQENPELVEYLTK